MCGNIGYACICHSSRPKRRLIHTNNKYGSIEHKLPQQEQDKMEIIRSAEVREKSPHQQTHPITTLTIKNCSKSSTT
jgi:hypothetical protein